jgi:2-methylcitrate dehydratase PrpD
MSVFCTKPISGIRIEGMEIDLRPKEPLGGTYEAPTTMNVEIKVDDAPDAQTIATKKPRGKPISGRVWAELEEKTSTKHSKHKPSEKEANYRKARILQIREFSKVRKQEIAEKVIHL